MRLRYFIFGVSSLLLLMIPLVSNADFAQMIRSVATQQLLKDIPLDHPNFLAITMMADEGAVQGYPDGTFKPDNPINRAEMIKMLVAYNYVNADLTPYKNCFKDVGTDWYAPYVCFAKDQKIIDGYPDGTFRPGNNVNRAEAIKIGVNAFLAEDQIPDPTTRDWELPMPADMDHQAWYAPYLRFVITHELVDQSHETISGNDYFYQPAGNMTRKEVAELFFRIYAWVADRGTYAISMATSACYWIENPDKMTTQELTAKINDNFTKMNYYTPEQMQELTAKWKEDNVVQTDIKKNMMEDCTQETIPADFPINGVLEMPVGDPYGD